MDDASLMSPRGDVRFRRVGGEGVVVKQSSAEVIAVNEVGARVLELIEEAKRVDEIQAALLEEFDVDGERLRSDVRSFLDTLVEAGVIEEKAQ